MRELPSLLTHLLARECVCSFISSCAIWKNWQLRDGAIGVSRDTVLLVSRTCDLHCCLIVVWEAALHVRLPNIIACAYSIIVYVRVAPYTDVLPGLGAAITQRLTSSTHSKINKEDINCIRQTFRSSPQQNVDYMRQAAKSRFEPRISNLDSRDVRCAVRASYLYDDVLFRRQLITVGRNKFIRNIQSSSESNVCIL